LAVVSWFWRTNSKPPLVVAVLQSVFTKPFVGRTIENSQSSPPVTITEGPPGPLPPGVAGCVTARTVLVVLATFPFPSLQNTRAEYVPAIGGA